jgi:HAD superfamily hydrolase (TIGR01662 family)
MGVLGGLAAQGRSHREVFEFFRPGFDLQGELERWREDDPDGLRSDFDADDLYSDVRPTFSRLREMGKRVVIAGNQPPRARESLEAMGLHADAILISADLGFEKPSLGFFEKVSEAAGARPDEMLYVGDRLDNDVLPARSVGMQTALIRRGPWGYLHAEWLQAAQADSIIDSLSEVPDLLV